MTRVGTLAALALCLPACEAGWLHERGLRVIREVGVAEAARLLEDPATGLIQVRAPDSRQARVSGTAVLQEHEPLPANLGPRVVILAEDGEQGLRMAARLSRAGIQEITVLRGGVGAWLAARPADALRAQPAPAGPGGEPSRDAAPETGPRARKETSFRWPT